MRRLVMYILLLVVCCFCSSSSAGNTTTRPKKLKCVGRYILLCAVGKRNDIVDGLPRETDLTADGERRDIQAARRGEGRKGEGWGSREGGEREIVGYRGSREGDDDNVRSELNDVRRQMSDEVELVDIGNHRQRHSPRSAQLDSAIDRLRSLLGTTDLDVYDRVEAEEGKREELQQEEEDEGKREERQQEEEEDQEDILEVEEEPLKHSKIDTDRSYIINETQTLLSKILDDIERRLDSKPVSVSGSKK